MIRGAEIVDAQFNNFFIQFFKINYFALNELQFGKEDG